MAVVNRYTTLRPAIYNPLSLQEMAYAPSILRQRHDAALESAAATQAAAQQYDVLDPYGEVASQLVDPLTQELDTLSSDLATKGVKDSNAIKRTMDLRGQQTQLFSPRGGIGQLQAATQTYRSRAGEIKEFFKDQPEIANYYLSQLRPGEAKLNDGKISLGNIQDVNYVKHIDEADILERAQKGAERLDPSQIFGDNVPEGIASLNFTDLYRISKGEGVTAQRAQQTMNSLIGREDIQSIVQSGAVRGLQPEESLSEFQNKIDNLAKATANVTTDDKYFQIDDFAAKESYKRQNEDGTFTPIIPGVAQQTEVYSNLAAYKPGGSVDYRNRAAEILGPRKYPDNADYETRRIIDQRYNEKLEAKIAELKDPNNSPIVNEVIQNNPQLRTISEKEGNKKTIDIYNKFYQDVGANYTDVYGTSEGVSDAFNNLYKARLDQYQVINPDGKRVDFKATGLFGGKENPIDYSTLEMVGITNKFSNGTMVEMRYKEDDDDKEYKTIYVEPPKQVSRASVKSKAIDEMIINNEAYKDLGLYELPNGQYVKEIAIPNYRTRRINVIVLPSNTDVSPEQLSNMSKEEINNIGGGIMDANQIIQREIETGLKAFTTKGTQYIKNTEG
jgi:O6-methylguanine-DNA--protein-cysteine methyltransferase